MAKIIEYPEAQSFDAGDVILKDGTNGTKKMTVETLKSLIAPVDSTLSQTGKAADAKAVGDSFSELNSSVDGINEAVFSDSVIDLTQYAATSCYISTSTDKWQAESGDQCWLAPVSTESKFVSVTANSTKSAMIAFLSSNAHTTGSTPGYVSGESLITVAASGSGRFKIPDGCSYIYVAKASGGDNYTPASFAFENSIVASVDATLSQSGKAADAKAVGDRIEQVEELANEAAPAVYHKEESEGGSSVNSPLQITNAANRKAKSAVLVIKPVQSGSGDPSSSNIRPISGVTSCSLRWGKGNLFTGVKNSNTTLSDQGVMSSSTGYQVTTEIDIRGMSTIRVYYYNGSDGSRRHKVCFYNEAHEFIEGSLVSSTSSKNTYGKVTANVPNSAVYMRVLTCMTSYLIIHGDSLTTAAIPFPEGITTIYGGEIDLIAGKLTVTKEFISAYNGETLPGAWISSMDVYEEGGVPTAGAQVVYDLAEPVVYTIPTYEIVLYEGNNILFPFRGDIPNMLGMKFEYAVNNLLTGFDIDTTLSETGKAADAKATGDSIDIINNLLLDGYSCKITSDDLRQQGFTTADGISASTTRIGLKKALPVREGTRILYPYTGLYYMIWFLRTPDLVHPDVISNISWSRLSEVIVPEGCNYIYTAMATAATSSASSTIVPSDFTGEIIVINKNYIDTSFNKLKARLDNGCDNPYVLEEADKVSDKVRNVQTGNSLTFAAISDMHYNVDDDIVKKALIDMRDGVNKIKDQVNLDFFVSFGDITYRLSSNGNFEKGKAECIAATKLLNACFEDRPQIRLIGNHDPNSEASTGYFTANQMGAYTAVYSNLLSVRDESHPYAGIGFHDFERQKLRLIALDTSFYDENSRPTASATYYAFGDEQAYWLCQVLDMSDKDDANEWQIIIVSHIHLDLSDSAAHAAAIGKYSAVADAYVKGESWSGGSYSYDFSGKNAAMLALTIHGHSHLFSVKNLRKVNSSATVINTLPTVDLYVPNALPDRDGQSMDGDTYTKTSGTAESTTFQIITLDPVGKMLYAHHYGAGIDIVVHYEPTIETNLVSTLTDPVWHSKSDAIATVENGVITPVSTGNVIIYAKSETDNCIECWNYNSVVV